MYIYIKKKQSLSPLCADLLESIVYDAAQRLAQSTLRNAPPQSNFQSKFKKKLVEILGKHIFYIFYRFSCMFPERFWPPL